MCTEKLRDASGWLFEGPEKKVEIIYSPESPSLRRMDRSFWNEVLLRAGTEELSRISNEYCDALLLSESSLFIFDSRLVMITCGRTTLADAVVFMIDALINSHSMDVLIYERKNHNFPWLQKSNFYDDTERISSRLPGSSMRLGDADSHHVYLFSSTRSYAPRSDDQTLEILMNDIDDEMRSVFQSGRTHTLEAIHRQIQATQLLPGFSLDEHVFEPQGYSLNALRGAEYYTMHVTPQDPGSFVSFETNHDFRNDWEALAETISRVVHGFRPINFDVLFFRGEQVSLPSVDGYECTCRTDEELDCGYWLHYRQFRRTDHSGS